MYCLPVVIYSIILRVHFVLLILDHYSFFHFTLPCSYVYYHIKFLLFLYYTLLLLLLLYTYLYILIYSTLYIVDFIFYHLLPSTVLLFLIGEYTWKLYRVIFPMHCYTNAPYIPVLLTCIIVYYYYL